MNSSPIFKVYSRDEVDDKLNHTSTTISERIKEESSQIDDKLEIIVKEMRRQRHLLEKQHEEIQFLKEENIRLEY